MVDVGDIGVIIVNATFLAHSFTTFDGDCVRASNWIELEITEKDYRVTIYNDNWNSKNIDI